jgi:hypothetical protein
MQQAGFVSNLKFVNKTSDILDGIFSIDVKKSFYHAIKKNMANPNINSLVTNVTKYGATNDVIVNALFAVQSSCNFASNTQELLTILVQNRQLFEHLILFNKNLNFPLISNLNLDRGFSQFEQDFTAVLSKQNINSLDFYHNSPSITNILDRMTTLLADWFGCLYPNSTGLNDMICKNVLDHVVNVKYEYMYNLVAVIPDNLQQLITDPIELKLFIKTCITDLITILYKINPNDLVDIVSDIQKKTCGTDNKILILENFYSKPQEFMITIINHYIVPNIDFSVDLFYQVLPIFLMFVLLMENFRNNKLIRQPDNPIVQQQILQQQLQQQLQPQSIASKPEYQPIVQQPVYQQLMTPVAQPVAAPMVQPVYQQPIVAPVAQSLAAPMVPSVYQQPIVAPVAQSVAAPLASPIYQQSISQPIVAPIAPPVYQQPIVQTIAQPIPIVYQTQTGPSGYYSYETINISGPSGLYESINTSGLSGPTGYYVY